MNPIILAGILRNFYDDFSMDNFSDRLRLQKIVYLLKSKDINLGYNFGLYLYGPYSKSLTRDGFQMLDLVSYGEVEKIVPSELKEIFLELVNYLKKDNNHLDDKWLEIIASYVYLKRNCDTLTDNEIFQLIANKRKEDRLDLNEIERVIKNEREKGYFRF